MNPSKPKSNQDAFDRAWNWLVVENKPRCIDGDNTCLYRQGAGNACVIGAMIPDDLIVDPMYNGEVNELLSDFPDISIWFDQVSEELLQDIQYVHDKQLNQFDRAEQLSQIATKWKLGKHTWPT